MNTRSSVAVAVLTFVAGIAAGVAITQSSVLRALGPSPATQLGPTSSAASIRGVLADLLGKSPGFLLTGAEDYQGRCNVLVKATALRDDYMAVKPAQGVEFFLPYTAIYRVDREGPGNISVPVVYTTAHPRPKFCGD